MFLKVIDPSSTQIKVMEEKNTDLDFSFVKNDTAKGLATKISQSKPPYPRLITSMDQSNKYMNMVFFDENKSKEVQSCEKYELKQTIIQVDLEQMNAVDMTLLHKYIGEMVSHRLFSMTTKIKKLQEAIKKLEKRLKDENVVNRARALRAWSLESKLVDVSVDTLELNLKAIIQNKEFEIKALKKDLKVPNN